MQHKVLIGDVLFSDKDETCFKPSIPEFVMDFLMIWTSPKLFQEQPFEVAHEWQTISGNVLSMLSWHRWVHRFRCMFFSISHILKVRFPVWFAHHLIYFRDPTFCGQICTLFTLIISISMISRYEESLWHDKQKY